MPRRRRTKVGTRPKPQLPAGSEEVDMTEEEKKAKLAGFLRDFDVQVELRVAEIRKQCNQMCRDIQHAIRLESSKLSKEIKNMKASEYFGANDVSKKDQVEEEISKTVDDIVSMSLPKNVLQCLTSNIDSEANVPSTEEEETDSDASTTKTTKKGKKKTGKATAAKKTTSTRKTTKTQSVTSENENVPPPSEIRRSTRKRVKSALDTPASQRNSRKGNFQTPADKIGIPNVGTPFITPKFDPRTVTPASVRRAKKGEILVSLSGSPVEPKLNSSPAEPKSVEEWVQDVHTNMANIFPDEQRLDEVDRKNILMLQETLNKMLKGNQVPSV